MDGSSRYILLVTGFVFMACTSVGGGAEKMPEERKLSKEELFWQRLRAKADTAYAFCKQNDMNTSFCFLVDMGMHSGKKRFFVWDFELDTVLVKSMCAHGYGMNSTTKNPVFSNVPGSYCTSLGKYKTGARSYSNWGINIHYKLHGLESTNNNAFDRIIVLHSYKRVPSYSTYPFHLPLGYSQGCPVIDDDTMRKIDEILKPANKPSLLWIYN